MSVGRQVIEALEEFTKNLETGKPIKKTEVRRISIVNIHRKTGFLTIFASNGDSISMSSSHPINAVYQEPSSSSVTSGRVMASSIEANDLKIWEDLYVFTKDNVTTYRVIR